jgi:hypothetical protein
MSKAARIAIAVTAVVVSTLIAVVVIRASSPEPKQIACGGIEMENPLGNGELMTPEGAERAFNPPVVRPQIDIASDDTIAELWVRPSPGGQVYIVYDSEMIVNVRPVNRGIREMAEAFIEEDPRSGRLIQIRGVDVFTAPPQPPCFGGNAVLNVSGAQVAVINDGDLPYREVWRVAESILETASAVIAADAALDRG